VVAAATSCGAPLPEDWQGIDDVEGIADIPVVLKNVERGCFHSRRAGDEPVYLSLEGLEALRSVALASRFVTELDVASLGLTPERFREKRSLLIDAAAERRALSPGDFAGEAKSVVTLEYVREAAYVRLTWGDTSTSKTLLELHLPGDPGITVSSTPAGPWMLPWTVTLEDESWQTYSTELPLALAKRLPPSIPSHRLLDGREYWNETFWEDRIVWLLVDHGLIPQRTW
jgi:hypothetical protein